jgi:hypothetical protein
MASARKCEDYDSDQDFRYENNRRALVFWWVIPTVNMTATAIALIGFITSRLTTRLSGLNESRLSAKPGEPIS